MARSGEGFKGGVTERRERETDQVGPDVVVVSGDDRSNDDVVVA